MQPEVENKKLIRVTTVPISLKVLLKGQLRFMSKHFDVIAVSSPGPELDDVEKNEGVKTVAIKMSRSLTPIADLVSLWKLYRLFKKEKPAVVHTHTPKAGLLGMIAAKFAGVGVRMHTVAGLPLIVANGWKRKLLVLTEYITYKCANRVYPNSNVLMQYITEQKFCDASKLKVIGYGSSNGIDTAFFSNNNSVEQTASSLQKKLGIDEQAFVFIFIGRLVKDKGIGELVSAFDHLHKKYNYLRLLLVGDYEDHLDPLNGNTKQMIDNHPAITHVGFQHDIRPFLQLAHVLTFPTYREGFPNVPMQAACMNVPSIVTDINGCNEIIEHEMNGLIIPVRDVAALQKAMERTITSRALYMTLRANSRLMIVEKFEQRYIWNLLLSEYKEMINHAILPQVYQNVAGSAV